MVMDESAIHLETTKLQIFQLFAEQLISLKNALNQQVISCNQFQAIKIILPFAFYGFVSLDFHH